MSEFDTSFNVVFGTSNKNIDWFDNPFVEPKVYMITESSYTPYISEDIKSRKCDTKEDLEKFMKPNVAAYYPNSLCFEDSSKIKLYSNWFDDKYESAMIILD